MSFGKTKIKPGARATSGVTARQAEPKSAGNYCGKCCQKRVNCGGRCNVCGGKLA